MSFVHNPKTLPHEEQRKILHPFVLRTIGAKVDSNYTDDYVEYCISYLIAETAKLSNKSCWLIISDWDSELTQHVILLD